MYFIHHRKKIKCTSVIIWVFPLAFKNIQKYLEIVSDLYVEPINKESIGSFLIPIEGSGHANRTISKQPGPSKKGRPADAYPKPRQVLDIRMLFKIAETRKGN